MTADTPIIDQDKVHVIRTASRPISIIVQAKVINGTPGPMLRRRPRSPSAERKWRRMPGRTWLLQKQ